MARDRGYGHRKIATTSCRALPNSLYYDITSDFLKCFLKIKSSPETVNSV